MSTRNLPEDVFDHLSRLLFSSAHPLVLHFDAGMRLVDIAGDIGFWGLLDSAPKLMTNVVRDLLIGIDTKTPQMLPMLELSSGHIAHLHVLPQDPGFAAVLLDASADAALKRDCQQEAHEAELDAIDKSRIIARLRASVLSERVRSDSHIVMPDQIVETFESLMAEARAAGENDANAMNLATAQPDGRVSSRIVLMKSIDTRGLVFYTNLESDKGRQLQAHPRAALTFHWKALRDGVQVRFEGQVTPVSDAEADAYFATRPRASQIGAWASFQSQTLPGRETFEQRCASFDDQFAGREVTRPPHWSGLRVAPDLVEFWYGVQFRLHDRHRHEWRDGGWSERLLYP